MTGLNFDRPSIFAETIKRLLNIPFGGFEVAPSTEKEAANVLLAA